MIQLQDEFVLENELCVPGSSGKFAFYAASPSPKILYACEYRHLDGLDEALSSCDAIELIEE